MTELSEQEFLNRLYDVVYKLSTLVKTQSYRFKKIWDDYLKPLNDKPHIVRSIPLEKDKFFNDLEYRINVLKTVEQSMVDGFYSIKSFLQTVYNSYIKDSNQFKKDFSSSDQLILKYFVAKEVLGNLLQYNQMDHETVPLKYNIIARTYLPLKNQGMTDVEILESLNKVKIVLELDKLRELMEEIERDGFVTVKKESDHIFYKGKELDFSAEGKKKYSQTLRPLVDWVTEFWRSFYNVRELNVTISNECKYRDEIHKILSKSATQGFTAADFVMKNLAKYYEQIKAAQNR